MRSWTMELLSLPLVTPGLCDDVAGSVIALGGNGANAGRCCGCDGVVVLVTRSVVVVYVQFSILRT